MAKVPFSKLDVKINGSDCINTYYNSKGEEIEYEIKQYLPLKEKIELVQRVINQSVDDNGFYNPMRVKLYMARASGSVNGPYPTKSRGAGDMKP